MDLLKIWPPQRNYSLFFYLLSYFRFIMNTDEFCLARRFHRFPYQLDGHGSQRRINKEVFYQEKFWWIISIFYKRNFSLFYPRRSRRLCLRWEPLHPVLRNRLVFSWYYHYFNPFLRILRNVNPSIRVIWTPYYLWIATLVLLFFGDTPNNLNEEF